MKTEESGAGIFYENNRHEKMAPFTGRIIFCLILWITLLSGFAPTIEAFSLQNVREKAQKLAAQPFAESSDQIPEFLRKITYDQWRDIRFKHEHALWRNTGLPFTVEFFHPGFYYDRTVTIHIVDSTGVKPVGFSRNQFDYGKNTFQDQVPAKLGFAGFRLHNPIHTKKYYDEVVAFLGPTYFRAVARNQTYGLTARGLAIDTALSSGEEIPFFTEFWIVKPLEESTRITVYALLDSPRVTGAYEFIIKPGKETMITVNGTIYRRKEVQKLGIAPLTSMFFYGENNSQRPVDDFRPEIHTADGLLVSFSSGEWLWHPLINPRILSINSFKTVNPRGFGLMQRDVNFSSYQDLETRYDKMPSVWIAPQGNWGSGHLELIQIPTDTDLNDNIMAFWVPEQLPAPGTPVSFSYRMIWQYPHQAMPSGGQAVATYTAKGKTDDMKKFVIDFTGSKIDGLPSDTPLAAVITVGQNAKLVEQQLYKNTAARGWRLVFQIQLEEPGGMEMVLPKKHEPVELRAFLKRGNDILTETWSYTYIP